MDINYIKQDWKDNTRYTFTAPHGIINVSVRHNLPTIAYISDFYVEEPYRGGGIGDALFTHVMEFIKNTLKLEGTTLSCHEYNAIMQYYMNKWSFCKVADEGDGFFLMFKKL